MRTSEVPKLASYSEREICPETMENIGFASISCRHWVTRAALLLTVFALGLPVLAQECKMGSDLDAATKQALDTTAQNYYQMTASGNLTALQQSAIPSVASDFGGIQSAISERKADFGPTATVQGAYELDAPGTGPIARAEFFCGIFNSPDHVTFVIPNLPPGRYGLVMLQANGGKQPMNVSFIVQQYSSGKWKLAGFYARPSSLAGHDGSWYLNQARAYKAKGESLDAWLYYLSAWDLSAPVPFMSTASLDKISDEAQEVKPAFMPTPEKPLLLNAGAKTYNVTQLFAVPVSDGLGLVAKFQVPDVSNVSQTYQDNVAVIKALVAKYPQLREGFSSIVARAVAPNGQDYGTLLAMKDVK